MLSFQRDNNVEEPLVDKQDSNAGKDSEYYTVATHGKQVRKSNMLLAILFVAGLACLGFMIKRSSPKAASGSEVTNQESEIQIAIARLTGVKSEMFNRMGEIVEKFYEFSGVKQVEVDELAKNPFEFQLVPTNGEMDTGIEVKPRVDPEILKRREMIELAKDLKVLSIMQSNRGNCCMIGDKFLYEGDVVKDFTITDIEETYVKLLWSPEKDHKGAGPEPEDLEIVLKLSE